MSKIENICFSGFIHGFCAIRISFGKIVTLFAWWRYNSCNAGREPKIGSSISIHGRDFGKQGNVSNPRIIIVLDVFPG